ncbi:MAG: sulfate adenylyltransferase subunit CysD [Jatrophihabitantaceae bacterium]
MPESVDSPAPLSTTTPPPSTSACSASSRTVAVTRPWCRPEAKATCRARPWGRVVQPIPDGLAEWAGRPHAHRKAPMTTTYELTDLEKLEAEAVHIFREVAATIERPALLFSGGKDSVVMLHLAVKAFWPAPVPFPVMHVDTGQNFDEVIDFRDRTVAEHGLRLIVAKVQDDIDAGRVVEDGPNAPRNRLQTVTLLRGIRENRFGAVFGGARRDEEKARAKERVFSFRDEFGAWDPRNQRPELWNLYNGRHRKGENIRVFPLSNWTELDIWSYIRDEGVEIPDLYFAHKRQVVERDSMLLAVNRFIEPRAGETPFEATVRYRTIGDATCTGCVESLAATPDAVVDEVAAARVTERGATRADDRISEAGMEDRKKEGYF